MVPVRAGAAWKHEPGTPRAIVKGGYAFVVAQMQAPKGGAAIAIGPHAGPIPNAAPIRANPALNGAFPGREIEAGDRSEIHVPAAIQQQTLGRTAANARVPVGGACQRALVRAKDIFGHQLVE